MSESHRLLCRPHLSAFTYVVGGGPFIISRASSILRIHEE